MSQIYNAVTFGCWQALGSARVTDSTVTAWSARRRLRQTGPAASIGGLWERWLAEAVARRHVPSGLSTAVRGLRLGRTGIRCRGYGRIASRRGAGPVGIEILPVFPCARGLDGARDNGRRAVLDSRRRRDRCACL